MPKYTEHQLEQAVNQAVATGNIKGSAEDWDVPSSILQDRLKGLESNPTEQTQRQRLTPEQEEKLASWFVTQRALGLPLTDRHLKEFAQRTVARDGDNQPIGPNWITGFLQRHPDVKV